MITNLEKCSRRLIFVLILTPLSLLGQSAITSIVINQSGYIFASQSSDGVLCSTNSGQTWEKVNNGLSDQYVNALEITSNQTLLAGTNTEGIFQSTDNEIGRASCRERVCQYV